MIALSGIIVGLAIVHSSMAAISFTIAPYNTTAGIGQTATLACIVAGKTSESVKWKKSDNTPLTVDTTVVGSSRYQVVGAYNLTISGVTTADEGGYVCDAGTLTKTAYLSVVDLPTNVSLYWSSPPIPGLLANLTCKAAHANPAPNFAWYKDDLLYGATPVYYTSGTSGYVDAYSVLPVRLTNDDQSSRFRCQLEYTGLSRAMEADLVVVLSSGGPVQTRNILVIVFGAFLSVLLW
ncbi:cell adhesion molecule 2-like [Haliotis rufescens]|uniref:cell adhesion molecule 2-like n=1 Tax=Haliotis rufescens TaxID=6454 RepID=UPI001EB01AB3|nr:cell adhesion molecule 2-like [Haliotis rufescens]